MKKTLIFILLVFGPLTVPPLWAEQDNGQSLFEKAQKYFKDRDYGRAKQALSQLVAKHPLGDFIPKARVLLADLQEDFDASTAQFKELAAQYAGQPEGEEAQKDLGARYFLADKYEEAADSYKEYLDQYPRSPALPEIRYWYACSLLALDKDEEAADQYRKVLQDSPDSPWAPKAFFGIGNAYFKMKRYGEAEKQYLRILDQYHYYGELNLVYLKLAQSYEAEGKYKQAHAAYQTLTQVYPQAIEVADAIDRMRELEKDHPDLPRTAPPEPPTPTMPPNAPALPAPTPSANPGEADPSQPFHVQIGVYSKKFNADRARKSVRKAGYSSYVVSVRLEGVPYTYYKVRVGSFATREEAEKAARVLTRKTGEKAIVVED